MQGNYKYHTYANSVVDVAMGNIQKLLLVKYFVFHQQICQLVVQEHYYR